MSTKTAIQFLALILALAITASAQVAEEPVPLTDEEFGRVLYSSDTLKWNRIEALTDEQAKAIVERDPPGSSDKNIKSTTDSIMALPASDNAKFRMAAEFLQRVFTKDIWLNGLKRLTDEQARIFSKFKGRGIHLNGIEELSDKQARYLGKVKGVYYEYEVNSLDLWDWKTFEKQTTIYLDGIVRITPDQMWELGRTKANISLNGLTEINEKVAREFKSCKANSVSLNGLTSLPDEIAKRLAKFKGEIDLDGLDNIFVLTFIKYGGKVKKAEPVDPYLDSQWRKNSEN